MVDQPNADPPANPPAPPNQPAPRVLTNGQVFMRRAAKVGIAVAALIGVYSLLKPSGEPSGAESMAYKQQPAATSDSPSAFTSPLSRNQVRADDSIPEYDPLAQVHFDFNGDGREDILFITKPLKYRTTPIRNRMGHIVDYDRKVTGVLDGKGFDLMLGTSQPNGGLSIRPIARLDDVPYAIFACTDISDALGETRIACTTEKEVPETLVEAIAAQRPTHPFVGYVGKGAYNSPWGSNGESLEAVMIGISGGRNGSVAYSRPQTIVRAEVPNANVEDFSRKVRTYDRSFGRDRR